ncbi:ROK family transcriptional regulator [Aquipuribacter hungaricus]|uniref:ROK family protein n=1 Tax=Aquipuribacter hungaricus TaxID=545624 RepID=A0ABV7WJD5_9MICO
MSQRPENSHQAVLLRRLRDDGPVSRAELGETVGLSRSRLAVELDRLTDLSLVESPGLAASRGGRRSAMVGLASDLRFLGVDVGATSVDVAVTDARMRVLDLVSEPVDVRSGPTAVLAVVLDLVGKLRATGVFMDLHGAGVGVPGPVSFRDGVPVAPPIMPGWNQFPVRTVLSQHLGCPVQLDNDVNIMALGEMHAGVARTVQDLLFVKVGTGVGCGIVVDGSVYRGASGSAGDIGHIRVDDDGPVCSCGNTGCLEAHFSGAALARSAVAVARSGRSPLLAERLALAGSLTGADVAVAADAGDAAANELVRDGGRRLGLLLAGLVSFFNPDMVVFGGQVASGLGHPLLAELRSVVYRRSLPLATGNLPIVLSELGAQAGVVGAARLISDEVFSHE